MLEGVVAPVSAHLFDTADQEAEAVELLRSRARILHLLINDVLEKTINELAVINFLLEHIVGLFGALFGSPGSKGMELVVARVNDLNVAIFISSNMLVVVVGLVDHAREEIIRVGLKGALEVTDRFTHERLVSKEENIKWKTPSIEDYESESSSESDKGQNISSKSDEKRSITKRDDNKENKLELKKLQKQNKVSL